MSHNFVSINNKKPAQKLSKVLLKNPEFVITDDDIDKMDDGDEVPFVEISDEELALLTKYKTIYQVDSIVDTACQNEDFIESEVRTVAVDSNCSAIQDAAETMLRLEDGVPTTSQTSQNIKSVHVSDFKPVESLSIAARSHVIQHRQISKKKSPTIVHYEINRMDREKLHAALDANDDLKFCEWVLAAFKNKSVAHKKTMKREIARIILTS